MVPIVTADDDNRNAIAMRHITLPESVASGRRIYVVSYRYLNAFPVSTRVVAMRTDQSTPGRPGNYRTLGPGTPHPEDHVL